MTKKEIKKAILNKELSFTDVLICFAQIEKINSAKKREEFFSDMDDVLVNMIK